MKKAKFLCAHRERILRTVFNLLTIKHSKPFACQSNEGNLNTCLNALSNMLDNDYSRAAVLAHCAVNIFPRMRNAPALIVEMARLRRLQSLGI